MTLDDGFDLTTENAQRARCTAKSLLKFFEANEKATEDFARNLLKCVRCCCSHHRPVTCHTFKERMCFLSVKNSEVCGRCSFKPVLVWKEVQFFISMSPE